MRFNHLFAALLGAITLAACQPPAQTSDTPPETTPTETASTTTPEPAPEAQVCGIVAHRAWQAVLASGGSSTLTVSGEIDLPSAGYSVSLARDANETPGAAEANLTLTLRPPAQASGSAITPHPVRYFGPAQGQYSLVRIVCDGEMLTDITVTR